MLEEEVAKEAAAPSYMPCRLLEDYIFFLKCIRAFEEK